MLVHDFLSILETNPKAVPYLPDNFPFAFLVQKPGNRTRFAAPLAGLGCSHAGLENRENVVTFLD